MGVRNHPKRVVYWRILGRGGSVLTPEKLKSFGQAKIEFSASFPDPWGGKIAENSFETAFSRRKHPAQRPKTILTFVFRCGLGYLARFRAMRPLPPALRCVFCQKLHFPIENGDFITRPPLPSGGAYLRFTMAPGRPL